MSESRLGSGMASGAVLEPEGFGVGNGNEKGQRDEGQRHGKYLR